LNEQKLQKLLRLKKLETPGQDYFDGFLAEFHRYQQAQMLRQAAKWEPWRAWFREFLCREPYRTVASCGAVAVVTALLVIGLGNFSRHSAKQSGFARTPAMPKVRLVSDSGTTEQPPAPRYSTGQTPLSYDKTIAF
jgi:hypothetical protein